MVCRGQFWPTGIVVACVCVSVSLCVNHLLVRTITWDPFQARITKFGPKMQNNLVKVPIVLWSDRPWPSRSNLRSKCKFTPFWACLHHNSSPIQARVTKFGPEVQTTLGLTVHQASMSDAKFRLCVVQGVFLRLKILNSIAYLVSLFQYYMQILKMVHNIYHDHLLFS